MVVKAVSVKRFKSKSKRKPKFKRSFKMTWLLQNNHVITTEALTHTLVPNAANYGRVVMASIAAGDRIDERHSNYIYVNRFKAWHSFANTLAGGRYIRFMLLRVKGSGVVPSATNADLFINAAYVAGPPTGTDDDLIKRVNRDVYDVLYDKIKPIAGNGTGTDNPNINVAIDIPVRKFVTYLYNSAVPRKGQLFYTWTIHERAGQAALATPVNGSYRFQLTYNDANLTRQL